MADVDFGDLVDWFAADGEYTGDLPLHRSRHQRSQVRLRRPRRRARQAGGRHQVRPARGRRRARPHRTPAHSRASTRSTTRSFRRGRTSCASTISDEFFDAAETPESWSAPFRGNRLAVLTNGGGVGVLAVDRLIGHGGARSRRLEPETLASSWMPTLPATWSRANPVDMIGDAGADRYRILARDTAHRSYGPTRCSS